MKLADWFPSAAYLRQGDAVAALGVCIVVLSVSLRLGRRTVDALLDSAPPGVEPKIAEIAASVPGVRDCHHVRARYSGPDLFIDLHVLVEGEQSLTRAHELTEEIEQKIQSAFPGADVPVHAEPV